MNYRPLIREWFYPEGPDTFEYLLPVELFLHNHDSEVPVWIHQFARRLGTNLNSFLANTLRQSTDLSYPHSLELLNHWPRIRLWFMTQVVRKTSLTNPASMGICCEFRHQRKLLNGRFTLILKQCRPLKHLLHHFGGTRIDVPPTFGFICPMNMEPAIEDDKTLAWRNIGNWTVAYPVFDEGNGDCVLVRSNGVFGKRCHAQCDERMGISRDDRFATLYSAQTLVAFLRLGQLSRFPFIQKRKKLIWLGVALWTG